MKIDDSNKTIAIKFARDQVATFVGLVCVNIYNVIDTDFVAPNFTNEGMRNIYIGLESAVNAYWQLFWAVTAISIWRFLRSESKEETQSNPPDHLSPPSLV